LAKRLGAPVTSQNPLRWPALVAARVGALAAPGAPGELAPAREVASVEGTSAASSPWLTRETAILWGILAVTAAVYLRSLGNAFVIDDAQMFVHNPDLRNWSFLWKAFTREEFWYTDVWFLPHYRNYRPLLLVWSWIDYHLFGLNPAPWHASIVAVYLLTVWLVFKVSRRLAGDSKSALLAASLYALTPVHVAAVVWMAACGMVLSTALGLGAFYLILPRADGAGTNWVAAIALYAGALLCHESLTAFPALVACYAFLFEPNDSEVEAPIELSRASLWRRARRALIWQAPFAIVLLLYFVARLYVLGFFVNDPYYFQNLLTDAQAVLTVPLVLVIYLAELLMPWRILPLHRVPPVSSLSSPEFWMPLAAIALLGIALVVVERRDPRRRLHIFCAAWIGITLAPMMVLHSMTHLVQDYNLFLPSVGWSLLLGDLIAGIGLQNAFARRLAMGAACAMLIVYAVALWRAEGFWHDDVAAARGYVEGWPESVQWHWNLAYDLGKQGDLADAEKEVRTALSLEPDRTGSIFAPHSRELHHYLGELLARRGDMVGAELEIAKSLNDPPDEDEKHPPRLPLAYNHDGIDLYNQGVGDANAGRTGQAIGEITQGLQIMKRLPVPDYGPLALLYIKLAELYDSTGNQQQVEAVLKEVDSQPEGELAVGLARARIRLNHHDTQGAEQILRELSDHYPEDYEVWMQLADLEFNLKQNDQALASYQQAGGIWFGNIRTHLSTAKVLYAMGRGREALDQCRLATALSPSNWAIKDTCDWIRNDIENKQRLDPSLNSALPFGSLPHTT
jgi:protein O-mannosyl-transferase